MPVSIGDNFYAKIKNIPTQKYVIAVNDNVQGIEVNCTKQQVWNFIKQTDNSYKIINCFDLRAMDLDNYGTAGHGPNIQLYKDWDVTAQRYYIYEMYGAYYIKPVSVDLVLDLSQSDDYNLAVWGAGADWPAQKFNIEKTERGIIGTHSYTSKVVESATCTEDGIKTYTCSTCGDTYTETIPATGHKSVIDASIPPTATESGLTQGEHCEVCGKVLVIQEVIQPLGVIGDADGDGGVNIMDATTIQLHVAKYKVENINLSCADVNGMERFLLLMQH